jgi:glycosyltransferase involved in cell wall biosynthesis
VPAGAPAYLLSAITGIPYILTAHGGDVPGGAPEKTARWFRFVMPFSRAIWKGAAKVAAVSQQTRQLALERYHADIRVIPNGIDTRRMQPRNLEIHSPPGILFSGRFSPEKNAAAIPMILAELKDLAWRCVMLGDGVDMEEVRQLIRLHGLQDRIRLTGWVNPEDVRQYMEKSDILLMPSLREGMPMAALQGLSMGLALILPNKGSCPDLIKENGFLTEPGNQPEIIQALKTLLTDNARLAKYRQNSRLHSAQFDLARSVEAYEALYQEAGRKAGG